MGGSSSQVTGYRYFTNFLLFIGNPIEKMLGINFDKRGWLSPFVDEDSNALAQGVINSPSLFGETEGGVAGVIHVQYGTDSQEVLPFYKDYMESKELQASAYPYQSYLAFTGLGKVNTGNGFIDGTFGALAGYMNDAFYVGNSGYMKEMLLWPKRTRIRNDGRRQWYEMRGDGAVVCEIGSEMVNAAEFITPEMVDRGTVVVKTTVSPDPATIPEYTDTYTFPVVASSLNYSDSRAQLIEQTIGDNYPYGVYEFSGTIDYSSSDSPQGITAVGFNVKVISIKIQETSTARRFMFKVVVFASGRFGIRFVMNNAGAIVNYSVSHVTSGNYLLPTPSPDINPVHKIREILTDDTAMNKPEASVNDVNFMKAADRIYDEGLGISWSITEKSCIDAINELCYHIEAGIRVNRQTGLYEMVLFRDNWFDENEIHTIAENKINKGSMQYEITNADEVINQVNVNFYDRTNIKNSSFSISESGLIQTLGRVNAETVDLPYFMNMRNAEIVSNWKLKVLSTGVLKGSFTTGWREARKWNRYDLIRLPWSKRWTGTILVRIMNIKLGGPTSNEVSIEWVEVVPSTGMMNTTIVADEPVNTQPEAPKPCNAKVFELPYFEAVQAFGEREVGIELADNPEAGYLCAIAEKPQNNSLNAALYVDAGSGFERVATVNYCETAYLDQSIDRMSSTFVVKNIRNIASVRVGSQIFINDETMVYQSYDAATKVLTVKRGAFGVPQIHAANSILYFADDFIAVDQTLYVKSEIVDAKVLTTTPSGILALDDAVTHEVGFNARAIRPYPPANVKINGEYWPTEILPGADLVLTWVDRNRAQQTGGEPLGFFDGGIVVEPNTQTHLILSQLDENNAELATSNANVTGATSYTMPISTMQADTRFVKITIKTVRDNYECIQPFEYIVELSQFFSAPYDLTVEFKND